MKLNGILDLGDRGGKVPSDQSDLVGEGELGSGTCGQVFRMRHKTTGIIMAVKVQSGNPGFIYALRYALCHRFLDNFDVA